MDHRTRRDGRVYIGDPFQASQVGATFNLPVYLDKKNRSYVEKMAQAENVDVSTVVNELVRRASAVKKMSSQ